MVRYHSNEARVTPGLRVHDRLIVHDNTTHNLGFGGGANAAAAQGTHPLVCFVNPDGDLSVECMNRLEDAMKDPGVVACSPDLGQYTASASPSGDL